jgi:hypothetical protein
MAFFLLCPYAQQVLRDVPVDAGFLCNEATVHGDTINGTVHVCSVCSLTLDSPGVIHRWAVVDTVMNRRVSYRGGNLGG